MEACEWSYSNWKRRLKVGGPHSTSVASWLMPCGTSLDDGRVQVAVASRSFLRRGQRVSQATAFSESRKTWREKFFSSAGVSPICCPWWINKLLSNTDYVITEKPVTFRLRFLKVQKLHLVRHLRATLFKWKITPDWEVAVSRPTIQGLFGSEVWWLRNPMHFNYCSPSSMAKDCLASWNAKGEGKSYKIKMAWDEKTCRIYTEHM